jgi:hypothetical protein
MADGTLALATKPLATDALATKPLAGTHAQIHRALGEHFIRQAKCTGLIIIHGSWLALWA